MERVCAACGERVEARFRFCPWCAAPQRAKLTELFRGHPDRPAEADRMLRVSRYLCGTAAERHVRLSVWAARGEAEAVLSLGEGEARRLGEFLLGAERASPRGDETERLPALP